MSVVSECMTEKPLYPHISSSTLLCGSFSAAASNSASLDGLRLCDGHRKSLNTTTTTEIDGQLESERRRLERVICKNSSNMQNEFSLHLPWARERGERERRGGKKTLFWAFSDLSLCWTRKLTERTRRLHSRLLQKQMLTPKKLLIFYVVLVSCKPCRGFYKWPLIRLRHFGEKRQTYHVWGLAFFLFSWRMRSDALWLPKHNKLGKTTEEKLELFFF